MQTFGLRSAVDYNFHTHTYRCHHATKCEREYIERAIAGGITEMGFSDHAPWIAADGLEPSYCVYYADVPNYFKTLRTLREEYRDKITLHIGFEVEYFPRSFPARLDELRALGAEYLILGEHFIHDKAGNEVYVGGTPKPDELLPLYVDAVIEGIGTGAYTYVAHPDVFCYGGDVKTYKKEMRRLCEAAKEKDVPLEINFLGIRTNRYYPTPAFWEVAGAVGAPVTFGFDAHDPLAAADLASLPAAMEMVEKYHLNYIGKPQLVLI